MKRAIIYSLAFFWIMGIQAQDEKKDSPPTQPQLELKPTFGISSEMEAPARNIGFPLAFAFSKFLDQEIVVADVLVCINSTAQNLGANPATAIASKGLLRGKFEIEDFGKFGNLMVGDISYRYEHVYTSSSISYRFFEYRHSQGNSDFERIGTLTEDYSENYEGNFTQRQYDQMIDKLKNNAKSVVDRLNRAIIHCTPITNDKRW